MGGVGSGRLPGTKAICGTRAKYQYHRKRGEHCQMCLQAATEWSRKQKGSRPRIARQPPSVRKADRKDWLIDQKVARVACMDCFKKVERDNTFVFDFDHRDPEQKSFAISEYLHTYTTVRLLHEMDKCDLICANCHRVRTNAQQKSGVLTGYKQNRYKQNRSEQLTLLDLTG
jgi:L-lysine 2,3-aminomutase